MSLKTLLLSLPLLFCSCPSLGIEPPVVFTFTVEGDMEIVTDVEHAVILGEGWGEVSVRSRGSVVPLYSLPFLQQYGDFSLVDGGEIHHHAFGAEFKLPYKSRALFTPSLLAKYPLLKFEDE